jgi:hypothetical protein
LALFFHLLLAVTLSRQGLSSTQLFLSPLLFALLLFFPLSALSSQAALQLILSFACSLHGLFVSTTVVRLHHT